MLSPFVLQYLAKMYGMGGLGPMRGGGIPRLLQRQSAMRAPAFAGPAAIGPNDVGTGGGFFASTPNPATGSLFGGPGGPAAIGPNDVGGGGGSFMTDAPGPNSFLLGDPVVRPPGSSIPPAFLGPPLLTAGAGGGQNSLLGGISLLGTPLPPTWPVVPGTDPTGAVSPFGGSGAAMGGMDNVFDPNAGVGKWSGGRNWEVGAAGAPRGYARGGVVEPQTDDDRSQLLNLLRRTGGPRYRPPVRQLRRP